MGPEIFLQCQFGQKKKDGKVIRPATCQNRASGIFRVLYVRGKPRIFLLCAQCSFDKMPNHVRYLPPPDDAPAGTPPTYFRDVAGVELLLTLGTDFEQERGPKAMGLKHWVERQNQLPEKKSVKMVVQVIESRGRLATNMDMSAYLKILKDHSDGK